MKKKILLSAFIALFSGSAFAHELTPQEALAGALSRLNSGVSSAKKSGSITPSSVTLSYTEKGIVKKPLFYVYARKGGGFIIAGADSRSRGLLGYTDNGDFVTAKENPAFQDWLTECTQSLQWLSQQSDEDYDVSASSAVFLPNSVAPLLGDIKWDQGAPYNNDCPIRTSSGSSMTAYTGCVATAAAQLMYHYNWPTQGVGSNTNSNGLSTDPNYTVDFSQSTYDWGIMKATYSDEKETGASVDAVAKLMSDIGCAVNMRYRYGGSGANIYDMLRALAYNFKYDKSATIEQREYYASDDWNALLLSELNDAHPVIMIASASGGNTGHAFILDGYATNGLYHVNWGWNGSSNGYFDINYMFPANQGAGGSNSKGGYNINQSIVKGLKKDEGGVAAPSLKIDKDISYDTSTGKLTYTVINLGLGEFTGTAGLALYDKDDHLKQTYPLSFANNPLSFDYTSVISLEMAASETSEGSYIKPYYSPAGSNEILDIPSQQSAKTYLLAAYPSGSSTLAWCYPTSTLPQLGMSDFEITRNYTGFAPKFKMTVSNISSVGYEGPVMVYVKKGSTFYCLGRTQVFLKPGGSRTIEVDCCMSISYSSVSHDYTELTDGDYEYDVVIMMGGRTSYLTSSSSTSTGTITMTTPAASNITYSGFNIDKTTLHQGEELTASFTATNTGGFDMRDYRFTIFNQAGTSSGTYLDGSSTDIAGNASTTVLMNGTIALDPGTYYGRFRIKSGSSYTNISSAKYTITVLAPTAINEIDEMANGKPAVIYDTFGCRVQSMRKGGLYIINGKKVMK